MQKKGSDNKVWWDRKELEVRAYGGVEVEGGLSEWMVLMVSGKWSAKAAQSSSLS